MNERSFFRPMHFALAALILVASAAAQRDAASLDRGEIAGIAPGVSRLRAPLSVRSAVDLEDRSRLTLGPESFLEHWLVSDLAGHIPGLQSVEILERVQARSDSMGIAATSERIVEVVGRDSAVRDAARLIRGLVVRRGPRIKAEVWMVHHRSKDTADASGVLETLTSRAFERRLDELARAADVVVDEPLVLEFASGREAVFRTGTRKNYVKDYELVTSGASEIFQPVISSYEVGRNVRAAGLLLGRRGGMAVSLDLEFAAATGAPVLWTAKVASRGRTLTLTMERPRVRQVTWRSGVLSLDAGEVGFRAVDLPALAGAESDGRLEVLCRFHPVALATPGRRGVVQGYDRQAGLAIVLGPGETAFDVGDEIRLVRGKQVVAGGVVHEVFGPLFTVRVTRGRVRSGDEVQ
ncbi:MAG TPA: hypothetical protein ENK43_14690 [Planctomycetes bacterium]|nr:hypothetical protein [Planctomycetota bacterium]